jgi:hypothetical protein
MACDRGSYERLRGAQLHQIRGALDDHVERIDWPRERIERYRTERLRALLGYARQRSPFHNLWGSTEIGVQAVGCGHGDGLHVCEDEVVLERVDASGEPVGPDQPAAHTLATGLAGTTFLFHGDLLRISRPQQRAGVRGSPPRELIFSDA